MCQWLLVFIHLFLNLLPLFCFHCNWNLMSTHLFLLKWGFRFYFQNDSCYVLSWKVITCSFSRSLWVFLDCCLSLWRQEQVMTHGWQWLKNAVCIGHPVYFLCALMCLFCYVVQSYTMRNSVLGVLGEMISRVLSGSDLDPKQKLTRDQFLDKLEVLCVYVMITICAVYGNIYGYCLFDVNFRSACIAFVTCYRL